MHHTRVNIYTFPHKGLRNALSQLLLQLSKANIMDASEIATLKSFANDVIELLHLHQEAEDTCVMTPLAERAPEAARDCHNHHYRLHKTVNDLQQQINALQPDAAPHALEKVHHDVAMFFSDYLKHMAEEETVLNEAIWAHYSDEEILEWQANIMAKLTFEQQLSWFKFIVPALNPMERQIILGGVKANAPQEAYAQVIKMLGAVLDGSELMPLMA